MIGGTAFLAVRIVRRNQRKRAIERIDGELHILDMRASLAPWIGVTRGGPLGLAGTLRF